MQKVENTQERIWYAQETIKHGWSRSILETWIDSNIYKRQGNAITNFKLTLPENQSDLVRQTLKDPYNFDFLTFFSI